MPTTRARSTRSRVLYKQARPLRETLGVQSRAYVDAASGNGGALDGVGGELMFGHVSCTAFAARADGEVCIDSELQMSYKLDYEGL